MFDPGEITYLTFDCYGTLIDWEAGILNAMQPLFERRGVFSNAEAILRSFVAHEARLEAMEWQPDAELLRAVARGIAEDFHLNIAPAEENVLSESLGTWRPFPDTVPALRRLAKRFRLAVLSNVDDVVCENSAAARYSIL